MDDVLWSKLPDSLIELIVAKLPWISILRLRALNKFWSAFVLSEDFRLRLLQAVPPRTRFGLVGINREGTGLKAWLVDDADTHVVPLHDFPLPACSSSQISKSAIALASSGGLLSIYVRGDRCHRDEVLVGNPVRSLWRKLPLPPLASRLPSYLPIHLSMGVDIATKEYTLNLVICKTRTTYSSATSIWGSEMEIDCFPEPPRLTRTELRQLFSGAFSICRSDHVQFSKVGKQNRFIFTAWDAEVHRHDPDMAMEGLKKVLALEKSWRSADLCATATDLKEYEMLDLFCCDDDSGGLIMLGGLRLGLDTNRVTVLQQLLMVYDSATQKWCTLPKVADFCEFFCFNRSDHCCMFVPSLTAMP